MPQTWRLPNESVIDEMLTFAGCVILASGNLRAQLYEYVSISDASLDGGASAKATHFSPLVPKYAAHPEVDPSPNAGWRLCPGECGVGFGTLEDQLNHRVGGSCSGTPFGSLPTFREIFSGPNAPLSNAVWAVDAIYDVDVPVDILRAGSYDCLGEGRRLERELKGVHIRWRHWAPDCRLFSRKRGRPVRLSNGGWRSGPPAVRNQR